MVIAIGDEEFSFESFLKEYLSAHEGAHKDEAKGPFVEKIKNSLIQYLKSQDSSANEEALAKKAQMLLDNILPFMYQVSAASFWNIIEPKVNEMGDHLTTRSRAPVVYSKQVDVEEGKPLPVRGRIEMNDKGVHSSFEADMKVANDKDTLLVIPMGVAYTFDAKTLSSVHYSEAKSSSVTVKPYMGDVERH